MTRAVTNHPTISHRVSHSFTKSGWDCEKLLRLTSPVASRNPKLRRLRICQHCSLDTLDTEHRMVPDLSSSRPQSLHPLPPELLWLAGLLACNDLVQPTDQVDLVRRNDPRIISSSDALMSHIEYKEDGDANIRGQEIRRVPAPIDEIGKSGDQ